MCRAVWQFCLLRQCVAPAGFLWLSPPLLLLSPLSLFCLVWPCYDIYSQGTICHIPIFSQSLKKFTSIFLINLSLLSFFATSSFLSHFLSIVSVKERLTLDLSRVSLTHSSKFIHSVWHRNSMLEYKCKSSSLPKMPQTSWYQELHLWCNYVKCSTRHNVIRYESFTSKPGNQIQWSRLRWHPALWCFKLSRVLKEIFKSYLYWNLLGWNFALCCLRTVRTLKIS